MGLEIHVQLTSLKSKLFCGCPSDYRGKEPNTNVCPVCLGLPGTLPVVNKKAVEYAVMAAAALNCKINHKILFFRKNYFYPDLPKNFQISQYDRAGGLPIGTDGYVEIKVKNAKKKVRIGRVHLEEDPGRLTYLGPIDRSPYTLVDYNRSGIALLEIVTLPDLNSPKEARILLRKLRSILEHLGVFDGSLEGAMRCDANVSIEGGSRVEIKNISSFKEVERALTYEIIRQRDLLSKERRVLRETRHWDERRRVTISLRTKEEEQDYRYFPEPDLPVFLLDDTFIKNVVSSMPELPDARIERFKKMYGLPEYDAEVLVADKRIADFFEECVKLYNQPKKISNWVMSDVLRYLYENNLEIHESKLSPKHLVEMIKMIDEGEISGKIAKKVLPEMIVTGKDPREIVKEKNLLRISSIQEIKALIKTVFEENRKAVEDALKDEKAIHFLVGQVMRKTRGRADPELTHNLIKEELDKLKTAN
ncbi:Asp-tRNA(Asn)/Glu-tRNA(Gln) amidotransferase GatCAB subunit B [Candidatus Bathyarchaeota archaeon]|nr:MAG: Asp-tRNA(Asn)/Glu-tRNA(Gln) amidotransferase GatCAB subunit B [Candidatus Bathyarchaeota archaeon]